MRDREILNHRDRLRQRQRTSRELLERGIDPDGFRATQKRESLSKDVIARTSIFLSIGEHIVHHFALACEQLRIRTQHRARLPWRCSVEPRSERACRHRLWWR